MEQNQVLDLVRRAKQGDQEAFTELYNGSYKMVYLTCLGHMKNPEEAEDATQDTFVTVYNKLETLEDDNTFFGWVKTIAVRVCLHKIRSSRGDISYDDAIESNVNLEGDDNLEDLPDTVIIEEEKRNIVLNILHNQLSEVQYQTIFMFYYNNMSIEQIAAYMECPVGTVKTRLKASRIRIKEGIEDYENRTGDKLCAAGMLPSIAALIQSGLSSVAVSIKPFSMALIGSSAGMVAGTGAAAKATAQATADAAIKATAKMSANAPVQLSAEASGEAAADLAAKVAAAKASKTAKVAKTAKVSKTAKKAKAAKAAGTKAVVTKVVAGVSAVAVLGTGTVVVVNELNKKKDADKKAKIEREESKDKDSDDNNKNGDKNQNNGQDKDNDKNLPPVIGDIEVGDEVAFGGIQYPYGDEMRTYAINWIVLDEQDDKCLVISSELLLQMESDEEDVLYKPLSESKLLEEFNEYFFDNYFIEEQQSAIIPTTLEDGSSYKMFFLSRAEVEKYFPDKDDRTAYSPSIVEMFGEEVKVYPWLIRGNSASDSAGIVYEGEFWYGDEGVAKSETIGARPAMWVEKSALSQVTTIEDIGDNTHPEDVYVEDPVRSGDTLEEYLGSDVDKFVRVRENEIISELEGTSADNYLDLSETYARVSGNQVIYNLYIPDSILQPIIEEVTANFDEEYDLSIEWAVHTKILGLLHEDIGEASFDTHYNILSEYPYMDIYVELIYNVYSFDGTLVSTLEY